MKQLIAATVAATALVAACGAAEEDPGKASITMTPVTTVAGQPDTPAPTVTTAAAGDPAAVEEPDPATTTSSTTTTTLPDLEEELSEFDDLDELLDELDDLFADL